MDHLAIRVTRVFFPTALVASRTNPGSTDEWNVV